MKNSQTGEDVPRQKSPGEEQLAVLDNSIHLLGVILSGTILQYDALLQQRGLLLERMKCPEAFDEKCICTPYKKQLASSSLIVSGIAGFTKQSKELACASPCDGDLRLDAAMNSTVLSVALTRLLRQLENPPVPGEAQQAEVQQLETSDVTPI